MCLENISDRKETDGNFDFTMKTLNKELFALSINAALMYVIDLPIPK